MTNAHNTVLYTGVTNELQRRVLEHKSGKGSEFTKKYNLTKLIYFGRGDDINAATPALHQTHDLLSKSGASVAHESKSRQAQGRRKLR